MTTETNDALLNNDEVFKAEYDEISPITGRLTVLVETDEITGRKSRLCMESGYTSYDGFIVDSEPYEVFKKTTPQLLQDLVKIDDENRVWFPITMHTPYGIFFPDGTTVDNWVWRIALIIPIPEEDKEKYPVLGSEGEYYESRLDVENSIWFDNHQFDIAFAKFYDVLNNVVGDEN
jgi:hypothetical protein